MEFREVRESRDVEVSEVEVLRNIGRALLCRISTERGARMVVVPSGQMRLGTTAMYPGDRGRLVIPQSLAADLGLAGPASGIPSQAAGAASAQVVYGRQHDGTLG